MNKQLPTTVIIHCCNKVKRINQMNTLIRKVYRTIKSQFINPFKFKHLRIGLKSKSKWYGNQYGSFYLNPDLINENAIVYSFGIGGRHLI